MEPKKQGGGSLFLSLYKFTYKLLRGGGVLRQYGSNFKNLWGCKKTEKFTRRTCKLLCNKGGGSHPGQRGDGG